MIAKAILFKAADKRYGTKLTGDHIGELKQVVVPYTLSLLNIITEGRLDLYQIWKNQSISSALSDFIYDLMKQVNEFILKESPVSHYIGAFGFFKVAQEKIAFFYFIFYNLK